MDSLNCNPEVVHLNEIFLPQFAALPDFGHALAILEKLYNMQNVNESEATAADPIQAVNAPRRYEFMANYTVCKGAVGFKWIDSQQVSEKIVPNRP